MKDQKEKLIKFEMEVITTDLLTLCTYDCLTVFGKIRDMPFASHHEMSTVGIKNYKKVGQVPIGSKYMGTFYYHPESLHLANSYITIDDVMYQVNDYYLVDANRPEGLTKALEMRSMLETIRNLGKLQRAIQAEYNNGSFRVPQTLQFA